MCLRIGFVLGFVSIRTGAVIVLLNGICVSLSVFGIGFVLRIFLFAEHAEFSDRPVESAFDTALVELDFEEAIFLSQIVGNEAAEELMAFGLGRIGFCRHIRVVEMRQYEFLALSLPIVFHGNEHAGFEAGCAEEAPGLIGDATGEEGFEDVGGVEFVEEVLAEAGVFFGVFIVEDDGFGRQPVLEGVSGGSDFALGGSGAGGFLRVNTVGGDLSFGGHVLSPS